MLCAVLPVAHVRAGRDADPVTKECVLEWRECKWTARSIDYRAICLRDSFKKAEQIA